jgi:hypothetical protein
LLLPALASTCAVGPVVRGHSSPLI